MKLQFISLFIYMYITWKSIYIIWNILSGLYMWTLHTRICFKPHSCWVSYINEGIPIYIPYSKLSSVAEDRVRFYKCGKQKRKSVKRMLCNYVCGTILYALLRHTHTHTPHLHVLPYRQWCTIGSAAINWAKFLELNNVVPATIADKWAWFAAD